jgi:hypothetical protein
MCNVTMGIVKIITQLRLCQATVTQVEIGKPKIID